MNPDPGYFFKIYWIITKQNFQTLSLFFLILMLRLWTNQKSGNFYNLHFYNFHFFNSLELTFLFSIWLIFYPLDPHIVADPDPGSLNLADPTNPDPKHFQYCLTLYNTTLIFTIILKILVTVNLLSRYYARLTVPLL